MLAKKLEPEPLPDLWFPLTTDTVDIISGMVGNIVGNVSFSQEGAFFEGVRNNFIRYLNFNLLNQYEPFTLEYELRNISPEPTWGHKMSVEFGLNNGMNGIYIYSTKSYSNAVLIANSYNTNFQYNLGSIDLSVFRKEKIIWNANTQKFLFKLNGKSIIAYDGGGGWPVSLKEGMYFGAASDGWDYQVGYLRNVKIWLNKIVN
ncbi:MAG: hypothetical protein LBG80_19085 [Bacteroidales bacterium]|jgi:hypothetical protein|nr:hypothetical protein [Bacteroidales bacterium]